MSEFLVYSDRELLALARQSAMAGQVGGKPGTAGLLRELADRLEVCEAEIRRDNEHERPR